MHELDAATAALAKLLERAGENSAGQVRLETWLWLDGPASAEGRASGWARELALDMNRTIKANGVSEGARVSGVDAWSRLEEIEVPTTVVPCALDVSAFNVRSREIAVRISGGALWELPDVAHLPSLGQPDEPAALIGNARQHL